jgi:hypothetical protein
LSADIPPSDRQEASIKDFQAKLDKKKTEIIQLQTSAQAAAGPAKAAA